MTATAQRPPDPELRVGDLFTVSWRVRANSALSRGQVANGASAIIPEFRAACQAKGVSVVPVSPDYARARGHYGPWSGTDWGGSWELWAGTHALPELFPEDNPYQTWHVGLVWMVTDLHPGGELVEDGPAPYAQAMTTALVIPPLVVLAAKLVALAAAVWIITPIVEVVGTAVVSLSKLAAIPLEAVGPALGPIVVLGALALFAWVLTKRPQLSAA